MASNLISHCLASGRTIVFADKVQFASAVIQMKEWSPNKINFTLLPRAFVMPVTRVILGISLQQGVETGIFAHDGLTSDAFKEWLYELAYRHDNPPAVFMENASIHASVDTKRYMNELNILPIYNRSYSPELNPIE